MDKNGTTRKCRVLYTDSKYGVQIITSSIVGNVNMGSTDFNASRASYNNAITTLNNEANKYLNTTYASSARSVGSVPNNPNYDAAGMFTSEYGYMGGYNGTFKNEDSNYATDYNKMKELNIQGTGQYYWMASRHIISEPNTTYFTIRVVDSNGTLVHYNLCDVLKNGNTVANPPSFGFRPIFTLKPEVKITGGDGKTAGTAYTLGI